MDHIGMESEFLSWPWDHFCLISQLPSLFSPSLTYHSPGIVTEGDDIIGVSGRRGVGCCHHFHQGAGKLLPIYQVLSLKNSRV